MNSIKNQLENLAKFHLSKIAPNVKEWDTIFNYNEESGKTSILYAIGWEPTESEFVRYHKIAVCGSASPVLFHKSNVTGLQAKDMPEYQVENLPGEVRNYLNYILKSI